MLYVAAAIFGLVVLYLGAHTSFVGVFVLVTCFVMLVFAGWLAKWVMAKDEGTVDMQEVTFALASLLAQMYLCMLQILDPLVVFCSFACESCPSLQIPNLLTYDDGCFFPGF